MTLKVKLRESSKFANRLAKIAGEDNCNPLNVEGEIVSFDGDDTELPLRVQWSNGFTNWYAVEDLEDI